MREEISTSKEMASDYIEIVRKKKAVPPLNLFVLSILGGAFVALAAVGANAASCMVDNAGLSKLIGACIFPAGLVMILITGAELFTGDCLMVIGTLEHKLKLGNMIRYWLIVYFGNFTGSLIVAWMVARGGELSLFTNTAASAAIKLAVAKTSIAPDSGFILGILCNFLVCIAVWMSYMGKNIVQKIAGLYFPVFLFVISGFEHCIANMYYVPVALFAKNNPGYLEAAVEHGIDISSLTVNNFIFRNLLPVTAGNIIGGSLLVGGVYWFLYLKQNSKKETLES